MRPLKGNPENLWKTEFSQNKTEKCHRALKFLYIFTFNTFMFNIVSCMISNNYTYFLMNTI